MQAAAAAEVVLVAGVESQRINDADIVHNVIFLVDGKTVRLECRGLSEATTLANLINESVSRAEVV